jgi:hypothetical protein
MTSKPSRPAAASLFLRVFLGLIRYPLKFLASLRLAVVLIALYAAVIAWASLLESTYGTPAVHFAVYGSRWFLALNILLAVNVFFAALIRFPWRQRQTGFVITHLGILILMAGCLLSWSYGIEAHLPVIEGQSSGRAYQDSQHIVLEIATQNSSAPSKIENFVKNIYIPFVSGPFNWDDYQNKLSWLPWRLSHRSQGVLYDRDGIRLEALNYYSRSRQLPIPRITLSVAPALGMSVADQEPQRLEMAVNPSTDPHSPDRPNGIGDRVQLPEGQRILFWLSGSPAETDAFIHSAPNEPLDPDGQAVLYTNGKAYHFSIKELREKSSHPLGDTGLEVELVGMHPLVMGMSIPGVELRIRKSGEPSEPMTLYATLPLFNRQDRKHGVFGTYWFPATSNGKDDKDNKNKKEDQLSEGALLDARAPRLEIIQGHDRKLYYRTWQSLRQEAVGAWPENVGRFSKSSRSAKNGNQSDSSITVFENTSAAVHVTLESFVASTKPDWRIEPLPFDKHQEATVDNRLHLRLMAAGKTEEFWLAGSTDQPAGTDARHVIELPARRVTVSMPQDAIELGFLVHLREFQNKLDPGSNMASQYSSLVDFLARDQSQRPLQKNVTITLNAPIDYTDPQTGRNWRLFQSGFDGPWKPGSRQFETAAGKDRSRDQIYLSILTVSCDPGRALKYAGSLLIILGIAVVYYMRKKLDATQNSPLPLGEG